MSRARTLLDAEHAYLGLASGDVLVVDHQPVWAELGVDIVALIADTLPDFDARIEHVGSTSVPGLAAKPILDVAVGIVAPFENTDVVAQLESAGFTYQADLGIYGGLLFTVTSADNQVVFAHVHVVELDDVQWAWYLAFRDGLRTSAELRNEYGALKRSAASEYATDREGYTKSKFDWVLSTVADLSGRQGPIPS